MARIVNISLYFDKLDHNDSFSTNNNSYVNPIDSSSSFSDHSDSPAFHTKVDLLARRNSRTEPMLLKKKPVFTKQNRIADSPCKVKLNFVQIKYLTFANIY